jgi:hypothetical protein
MSPRGVAARGRHVLIETECTPAPARGVLTHAFAQAPGAAVPRPRAEARYKGGHAKQVPAA